MSQSNGEAPILPVLIAGGGPVGLALAIELGMSGIRCILVEKRDGSVNVPKLSGLSIRSMEISRRFGVSEEAKKYGWPDTFPNDFVYCTSLTGYELARDVIPPYAGLKVPFTPEPPKGCAQIYFDPILLKRARSLPLVTIKMLSSLESFVQDADGVHATVVDQKTGRSETIAASYLVGCDGANGTVVPALGFGHEGLGGIARSYNVFFRSPRLIDIHEKSWARFYRFTDSRGTWGELIGIDGKELWRLSVFHADPGADGHAYIRRLASAAVEYEILSEGPWERRDRVTDRYRDGRVFICGDAAHETSPTGGLGMHTGFGEALDLGWKLSAVIQGWGGNALLDSYEIERRPIALDNVRVSTDNFNAVAAMPTGPDIDVDSPLGDASRRRFLEAFEPGRGHSVQFNENLRLGYCYETSPICVPDGTQRPSVDSRTFVPVARPGTRAPHAWIAEGQSTLDLFGRGFVLLRLGDAPPAPDALVDAARTRSVPLRVIDLARPDIAELYERRLVLVRPDGHVAWRGDVLPANSLELVDRVRGQRQAASGASRDARGNRMGEDR